MGSSIKKKRRYLASSETNTETTGFCANLCRRVTMSLGACCCRCCLFTVLVNLLAAKGHGALSDLSLLKCDLPPSLIRRSLSCSLALSLFRSAFLLSLSLSRSEPEDLLHSQSDMATLHIYLILAANYSLA